MRPIHLKKSYYSNNLIVHGTIQIWMVVAKQLKLRALSFTLPISANPLFTPLIMHGDFDQWEDFGLYCIRGL